MVAFAILDFQWLKFRRAPNGTKEGAVSTIGALHAIAEFAKHVPKLTVVTQNVDDLHERAGSQDVIHLHGSLHSPRCIDCGQAYTLPLTSGTLPEEGSRIEPPRCSACDGYVRLGVVWFGEMLPEGA